MQHYRVRFYYVLNMNAWSSNILMLSESSTSSVWKQHLRKQFFMLKYEAASLDDFQAIQSSYLLHRESSWQLLQELLRVDMDSNHSYHDQAQQQLNKIQDKK
jgi:hypothetical protein